MLLTEQEIDDLSREMVKGCKSVNWLAKKIESAVLEKLKAQEPLGYYENGRFSITVDGGPDKWRERKAYRGAVYTSLLPPDDVVRDAERYRFLRDEAYLVNPLVAVVWKRNDGRDESEWVNTVDGYSLDCHIDAVMKEIQN